MKRLLTTMAGAFALAMAAQPALSADIPARAPAYKAPVAVPIFNWSGFYVGGQAGYGWGESRHCETGICTFDFDIDGFVGGGTIGANYQWSNWVVGIEADISHADVTGSTTGIGSPFGCGAGPRCLTEVRWFGTARVRVGPAFDQIFPYVTGGIAFGKLHASLGNSASDAHSVTRSGWTVGAGVEYAFAPNWSAKLEYLYVDLGSFDYHTGVTEWIAEPGRFNVVRVGLNYRFATGKAPGPVTTRY